MVIHRTKFFLALCSILIIPLVAIKVTWLMRSTKTTGIYVVDGKAGALEQMRMFYSINLFMYGKDTIWFRGPIQRGIPEGSVIPVRYNPNDPSDAKVGTFFGIWGGTVIYGGMPLLLLLIFFVHPKIIPYRSKVRLSRKKPFVFVHSPQPV
jgi:hypothetical protein